MSVVDARLREHRGTQIQTGAFKGSMQHEPDEEVSWCNDVAHV